MGRLTEDESLRDRVRVFRDREEAGERLASFLREFVRGDELVLCIPSGGVPVGVEIAGRLSLALDLLIARKVQIPWNPEAGFGAVDPGGGKVFNEDLLGRLGLSGKEVEEQVQKTLAVVRRRDELFRAGRPLPALRGRGVILVDDGLASGYTMHAAVRFVRKRGPERVAVAVPTASERTVEFILPEVEDLFCLNVRGGFPFAVAEAYRNWHDLSDEEVISLIKRFNEEVRERRRI
jgi:putative phosphoribosyl transferase